MTSESPNAGPGNDVPWDALARYFAGESSAAEAVEMRRWLEAHPGEGARLMAIDRRAGDNAVDVDVEAALRSVHARMDAAPAASRRVIPIREASRSWVLPAALAAGVAFVVASGVLGRGKTVTRPVTPTPAAPRAIATGVGQRDSVQLADGSRVIVGPASRLTIPAGYGTTTRDVSLEGEAYFEVEHDTLRPFTVHAGATTIRDVGTAFTVRQAEAGELFVGVHSGSVELAAAGAGTAVLGPGDAARVRPGQPPMIRRATVKRDDLAWTKGALAFRETPMSEVRAELKRWYGIELRFADSSIANRTVTSSFTPGDSPAQVVRTIALVLGIQADMHGDTVILRKQPMGARPR